VVNRSVLMLLLVTASAAAVWSYSASNPANIYSTMMIGAIGGFVVGMATSFKRSWAPVTAPIYAVLQGLFIGALSLVMEQRFPGLVLQAVLLTFGVMFALLAAYQSRIIRPSETFKAVVVSATLGIVVVYMVSMVLQLFFHTEIPLINGSGPIGIAFSLVVVGIAALNLVLDFDFIENGVAAGAPKCRESALLHAFNRACLANPDVRFPVLIKRRNRYICCVANNVESRLTLGSKTV